MAVTGVWLILALVLAAGLWRTRGSSRWISLGVTVAALVVGVATWGLVVYVAAMPRKLRPVANGQWEDNFGRLLAASSSKLVVLGKSALLLVDLPSGRVANRLDYGSTPPGISITSVAWSGQALLFTYHDGKTGGWAALTWERWLAPPHRSRSGSPFATAHWDDGTKTFVIASVTSPRDSDNDQVTFRRFGETGEPAGSHSFGAPRRELPALAAFCRVGKRLFASGYEEACELGPEQRGVRRCAPKISEAAACPGHFVGGSPPVAWLASPQPIPAVVPPRALSRRDLLEEAHYVVLQERAVAPAAVWFGADLLPLHRVGSTFVTVASVSSDRAAELGYMQQDHQLLKSYDDEGQLLAERHLLERSSGPFIVESGEEMIVVSKSLDGAGRFDPKTLRRIDPPSARAAVRWRLGRWGGQIWLYDVALATVLSATIALPVPLGLAALSGRRSSRRKDMARRFGLLFLVLALPVLWLTAAKIWFF